MEQNRRNGRAWYPWSTYRSPRSKDRTVPLASELTCFVARASKEVFMEQKSFDCPNCHNNFNIEDDDIYKSEDIKGLDEYFVDCPACDRKIAI